MTFHQTSPRPDDSPLLPLSLIVRPEFASGNELSSVLACTVGVRNRIVELIPPVGAVVSRLVWRKPSFNNRNTRQAKIFCNAMTGIEIPILMTMGIEGIMKIIKADMFTTTAPLSRRSEA